MDTPDEMQEAVRRLFAALEAGSSQGRQGVSHIILRNDGTFRVVQPPSLEDKMARVLRDAMHWSDDDTPAI